MAPTHVANPEQFILQLLSAYSADQYEAALLHAKERLWENGFGVAIDDRGHPRGRVYLPYAGCRDCSPSADRGTPDYADALKYGTSRNPGAWLREVQVIADRGNGPNTGFIWKWCAQDGRSAVVDNPPYVPLVPAGGEPPAPPPVDPLDPPAPQQPTDMVELHRKLDVMAQQIAALADRPAPAYHGSATVAGFPGTAVVRLSPDKA